MTLSGPGAPAQLQRVAVTIRAERRGRGALNIYDYTIMYDFHLTAAPLVALRKGSVLGVSKHTQLQLHASFMKPAVEGPCRASAVVSCTMKEFSLRHTCDRLRLVRG